MLYLRFMLLEDQFDRKEKYRDAIGIQTLPTWSTFTVRVIPLLTLSFHLDRHLCHCKPI